MARRMTSEIIAALQQVVEKHGDMPFEVHDPDNGITYPNVTVFVNTVDNGACCDKDEECIGLTIE